ncbi:MAG TPA: TolC family protein [Terriglobales bacterium]|nr:TolC family protein [Terriglobales bacterium]
MTLSPLGLSLVVYFILLPVAHEFCADVSVYSSHAMAREIGHSLGLQDEDVDFDNVDLKIDYPFTTNDLASFADVGHLTDIVEFSKHTESVSLTLREYVDRIVAENPRITAARLDVSAADYEARSTYAAYLPHVSYDASVGYIHGRTLEGLFSNSSGFASTAARNIWFTEEGPGLTVPIYKDGSFLGINVPPEVKRKRAHTEIVKSLGSLTEEEVVLTATEAYLRAIKVTHLLDLRTQHFALAQKEAKRVEDRAKDNLATAQELGVARLLLATSRASFEAERGEAIYSFLAVADLLGLDASTVRIQESYPEPAPLPNFDMITGLSSTDHPKVRLQEATVHGAQADLELQRSRLFPTVTGDSYDFQYGDFHAHAENQWSSAVTVHVPVFDFGEAYLATKSASIKVRAENERLLAVQQDVRKDLADAVSSIKQSAADFAKAGSEVAEKQRVAIRLEKMAQLDDALLSELNESKLKLLDAKEALEETHYQLLLRYALYQKITAGKWKWFTQ